MHIKKIIPFLLLTLILSFSGSLLAQGPFDPTPTDPPVGSDPPPPPPMDPGVPIDGGVSLLLAAGAAYGVKKYREHKKKSGEGVSEK